MLVRDAPDLEVFVQRRNLDSVWIAGATIFPGGAVDADDRASSWAERCVGWDDTRASAALDVADGGLGFLVGAVRETFEEAGVLLARDRAGRVVDAGAEHLVHARDDLNAGRSGFAEFIATHDLTLATDELHVVSHWVTPRGSPRRYSTWFFLAAAPPGAYVHDDNELIASAWIRPVDALAAEVAGEIELILPTRKNLELLTRFDSVGAALAAARAAHQEGPPNFVTESRAGRRIALPGEAGEGRVPCPT